MEDITPKIKEIISSSISVKQKVLEDKDLLETLVQVKDLMVGALNNDKKILFCGNGGSAADAQHLAAELSGRFYKDRRPLFAEALHVNTSYITAVANDYNYDEVYSRLVQAKGRKGDLLFCITTSGNSTNIIKAAQMAHEEGVMVIGMTGQTGGKLAEFCNVCIKVPSADTPRIQETHIMIGHVLCELTEAELFEE